MGLITHSWYTTTPGVPMTNPYCAGWSGPNLECEYGDSFDIMSSDLSGFVGRWGRIGPGFNAANREWFGWLAPSRIATFSTQGCGSICSHTYSLVPLEGTAAGLQMVKIPTADLPGEYFTVEFRSAAGWDRGLGAPAVVIHEVRPNGLVYLVRRPTGSAGYPAGQTWSTTSPEPIAVTVSSVSATQATVTVARATPQAVWKPISGPVNRLLPTGGTLYALDANNSLVRYGGATGFGASGGQASSWAAGDRFVYNISSDGKTIWRYDGFWQEIGAADGGTLVAGGQSVYWIDGTGAIHQYLGVPFHWQVIGGPATQFIANDRGLYALTTNQDHVMRYTGTPGRWEIIGDPAQQLVVTANDLFAVADSKEDIYRWSGRPGDWIIVGGAGAQFVGNRETLYGLTTDRQAVMRFTGTPGVWEQIGGAADALYAGGPYLYALEPKLHNVWLYTR
jgi:hypothetical protein